MKKGIHLLAVALGLALLGCKGDLKSKLTGSWKVDQTSLKSATLDKLRSNKLVWDRIQSSLDATRFNFKSDGTLDVVGGMDGKTQTGKWTLDGNNLKVEFAEIKSPAENPKFSVDSDGSKIHLTQPGPVTAEMDLIKAK